MDLGLLALVSQILLVAVSSVLTGRLQMIRIALLEQIHQRCHLGPLIMERIVIHNFLHLKIGIG